MYGYTDSIDSVQAYYFPVHLLTMKETGMWLMLLC